MIQRTGGETFGSVEAAPGPGSPVESIDVERLMLELEDRILGELDRRGGRQAGWF